MLCEYQTVMAAAVNQRRLICIRCNTMTTLPFIFFSNIQTTSSAEISAINYTAMATSQYANEPQKESPGGYVIGGWWAVGGLRRQTGWDKGRWAD